MELTSKQNLLRCLIPGRHQKKLVEITHFEYFSGSPGNHRILAPSFLFLVNNIYADVLDNVDGPQETMIKKIQSFSLKNFQSS